MEMWQSPVYCNSLENCRVERHREFESHRFRQIAVVAQLVRVSACHAEGRGFEPRPPRQVSKLDVLLESQVANASELALVYREVWFVKTRGYETI
jgi:hypothetical protein